MKSSPHSFTERGHLTFNPTAKSLFFLMDEKQTNLAIAADVTTQKELLEIADTLGPHICILKTHVDILEDFTPSFGEKLKEIAEEHKFLIFEDRKFADIGMTVKKQYEKGIYEIVNWADIVNAHPIAGPHCIEALKQVGLPKNRALLLIAEMSTKGTFAKGDYANKSVEIAEEYQDFVMGFIAQRKLSSNPAFLHLTPGVKFNKGGDLLGQSYEDPHTVIFDRQSDIIIVGRGILEAEDPLKEAQEYRNAGWQAYLNRLT